MAVLDGHRVEGCEVYLGYDVSNGVLLGWGELGN